MIRPRQRRQRSSKLAGRGLRHAVILLLIAFATIPVLWMVSTSLKTRVDSNASPPSLIPPTISGEGYATAWSQDLGRLLLNSLGVSVGATVLSLLIGGIAGYALSRFSSRVLVGVAVAMFIAQIVPGVLLVIPFYEFAARVGLVNSYLGLTLAYTSFALPFTVVLLKGVFDGVPSELDDSARVDGSSRLGALFRVVAPVAAPGIAAVSLYSFVVSWSEFLFGFVLMTDPDRMPVTVALVANVGSFDIQWNSLMATALITALPPMVLYAFLERYLIPGLSQGAVKG